MTTIISDGTLSNNGSPVALAGVNNKANDKELPKMAIILVISIPYCMVSHQIAIVGIYLRNGIEGRFPSPLVVLNTERNLALGGVYHATFKHAILVTPPICDGIAFTFKLFEVVVVRLTFQASTLECQVFVGEDFDAIK